MNLLSSIPDTKTFIDSDMPNKLQSVNSFHSSTFSIEESRIDYFNKTKEFLEKK